VSQFASGSTKIAPVVMSTSAASSVSREVPRPGIGPLPATASLDADQVIVAANAEFHTTFARTLDQTCGTRIYELFHPSAEKVLPRNFATLLEERRTQFVTRVLGMRGQTDGFYAEVSCVAVRGEDRTLRGFVIQVEPEEQVPGSIAVAAGPRALLSPLESHILEAMATGASTIQMATRFFLSRQGVEYHVGRMLRKFKAPNRAALVSRAYSMGVLSPGSWPPHVAPGYVKLAG
jgi:DNA-binding CsgD family transcriptional regulator